VIIDRLRAERGTAGAVLFPMVVKGVARSGQRSGLRCLSIRRRRTGVALNGSEVLFSNNTEDGSAVRGHKGRFSLVFVGFEERDDNAEKDLVGRGARVVGRRAQGTCWVRKGKWT
jgi:hypothetical protein